MKKGIGIASGIIGILLVVFWSVMKEKENPAFSMIGGLDGPTSVFVAGKIGGDFLNVVIVIGVILIVIGIIVFLKKKN